MGASYEERQITCACCGKSFAQMRQEYPYRAKIVVNNVYHLPVGREFPFARLRGDETSLHPVVVRGNWPAFFHGHEYELSHEEVHLVREMS